MLPVAKIQDLMGAAGCKGAVDVLRSLDNK